MYPFDNDLINITERFRNDRVSKECLYSPEYKYYSVIIEELVAGEIDNPLQASVFILENMLDKFLKTFPHSHCTNSAIAWISEAYWYFIDNYYCSSSYSNVINYFDRGFEYIKNNGLISNDPRFLMRLFKVGLSYKNIEMNKEACRTFNTIREYLVRYDGKYSHDSAVISGKANSSVVNDSETLRLELDKEYKGMRCAEYNYSTLFEECNHSS